MWLEFQLGGAPLSLPASGPRGGTAVGRPQSRQRMPVSRRSPAPGLSEPNRVRRLSRVTLAFAGTTAVSRKINDDERARI